MKDALSTKSKKVPSFGMNLRKGFVMSCVLTASLATAAAHSATPTLLWRDAKRVVVQCLVQPTSSGNLALQQALCGRVRAMAARGAPLPISTIGAGDPAVLAPGTVALLVHASVEPGASGRLLAFSLRPYRASGGQADILFGAAPRAVILPRAGATGPAVDAAISAALADTLPWQGVRRGPRRIDGRS